RADGGRPIYRPRGQAGAAGDEGRISRIAATIHRRGSEARIPRPDASRNDLQSVAGLSAIYPALAGGAERLYLFRIDHDVALIIASRQAMTVFSRIVRQGSFRETSFAEKRPRWPSGRRFGRSRLVRRCG